MRQVLIFLLLSFGAASSAMPASRESAFDALTALPIEEISKIAKIAGCEGVPHPERWHFLVYAPEAENGYREYVVANHQVVARRELSQFAESIQADDVVGVDGVKVDSDRIATLAQQYARANQTNFSTCNFELSREGPGLAPRWKIDCFDRIGATVGSLTVNAAEGRVVAHDGFKKEPEEASLRVPRNTPVQIRRISPPPVAARSMRSAPVPEPFLDPVGEAPDQSSRPARVRRAQPVPPEAPRGPLSRVFRGIFGSGND